MDNDRRSTRSLVQPNEGTAIRVRFTYNGATHSDVVDVDATSPDDTGRWMEKVTTRGGRPSPS
jgi:hypothetical protein